MAESGDEKEGSGRRHVCIAEERRMLADLTAFPNLASMLAFEDSCKKNRNKNKNQNPKIPQLPNNSIEQHLDKTGQLAVTKGPKFQECVIISDDSDDEVMLTSQRCKMDGKVTTQSLEEKKREKIIQDKRGNNVTGIADYKVKNGRISKVDEYQMLADLTDFPSLASMLAFEAPLRENRKKKKKNKNKRLLETREQSDMEQHHEKPRQVPVIGEPKLQELVILSDDSESEVEKKSKRCKINGKAAIKSVDVKKQECGTEEERGNGIAYHKVSNGHISKMDKGKMPADLTDFPNLDAALAVEAKNGKAIGRTNRKKRKIEMREQYDTEQCHQKVQLTAATKAPTLQELMVPLDNNIQNCQSCTIDGEETTELSGVNKNEKSNKEEKCDDDGVQSAVHKASRRRISKVAEYKALMDLTDFPNLASMLAFEAAHRKKSTRKKRKKKQGNIESRVPSNMEQYHQKPKQMAATEEPNLQELLVLPASNGNRSMKNGHSSETKGLETTELREGKNLQKSSKEEEKCDNIGVPSAGHKVSSGHTSKADEYKTLVNLTNSPNLATMLAFEATQRKNRMKKKKGRIGFIVPINMVNTLGEDKQVYSSKERIPLRTEPLNIMDEIVPRKLLCRPRYFDHPESSRGMAEDDPASVSHTLQKRKQLCRLCGNFNHQSTHCKQVIYCSVCYRRGHVSNDCPEKHAVKDKISEICLRCGDSGHDLFSCSSDYSSDDLKEIQCFVCNAFGHLCCVDYIVPQGQVSCYKCGQSGHLGSVCMVWATQMLSQQP